MNRSPNATFGQRLTYARKAAGLSVGQLARLMEVETSIIKKWARYGSAYLRSGEVGRLADYCGVSIDWLQYGTETEIPEGTLRELEKLPEKDRQALIALLKTLGGGQ